MHDIRTMRSRLHKIIQAEPDLAPTAIEIWEAAAATQTTTKRELMRAAIYARVSTRDRGQDTANQLEQLRAYAAGQGWTVVQEYVDQESGRTADRSAFRRLMDDAHRRRFDVVLFWSLDRFSREGALETLQHLRRLSAAGVRFRSFTEQYIDSAGIWGEAIISILAVLAKQEGIRIAERTRAGMERARRQGKRIGRPAVALDPLQAGELRRQGLSPAAIAAATGASRATVRRRIAEYQRLIQQQPPESYHAGAGGRP